jgi:hypothetical protein
MSRSLCTTDLLKRIALFWPRCAGSTGPRSQSDTDMLAVLYEAWAGPRGLRNSHVSRHSNALVIHSLRMAVRGSTRAARRARTRQAASATRLKRTATALRVRGSNGRTPNSSPRIQRATSSELATPSTIPTSVIQAPCARTIRSSSAARTSRPSRRGPRDSLCLPSHGTRGLRERMRCRRLTSTRFASRPRSLGRRGRGSLVS